MNAATFWSRRLAGRLARHAAWVLRGAATPWADAMRHELDYITHDPGAVRWALGCIFASYRARLTHRPRLGARIAWRPVAASGGLMLVIGLALLETAGGQTAPPQVGADKTICDLPRLSPAIEQERVCSELTGRCEAARAGADHSTRRLEQSCADRVAPELVPSGR